MQSQAGVARSVYGYTPQYAPLEQVKGTGTDARSDLYSLGATLYHLLTGVAPPSAVASRTTPNFVRTLSISILRSGMSG